MSVLIALAVVLNVVGCCVLDGAYRPEKNSLNAVIASHFNTESSSSAVPLLSDSTNMINRLRALVAELQTKSESVAAPQQAESLFDSYLTRPFVDFLSYLDGNSFDYRNAADKSEQQSGKAGEDLEEGNQHTLVLSV